MRIYTKAKNPFPNLKIENHIATLDVKELGKQLLDKLLEIGLYLTCFFPFVTFIYTGVDTQPYAIMMALIIILIYWIRENILISKANMLIICICAIMGIYVLLEFGTMSIEQLFSGYFPYAALMIIPYGTYLILTKNGGINEGYVKGIIWCWFLVGFMQKYINSSFAYPILTRYTTNATRGVVGLATEPSAYGYMCVFMMIFVMQFKTKKLLYLVNLLIQIVLFASSSVALVYIAVYMILIVFNEILRHKKFAFIRTMLLSGAGVGGLYLMYRYIPRTNRIGSLLYYLFNQPDKFFNDGSIRLRIMAIEQSITGFAEYRGLPHGISNIRIMSGVGELLYSGGFLSVLVLMVIAYILWNSYPRHTRFIYTVGFFIVMLSSIPFNASLANFYLGYCIYRSINKEKQ